MVKTLIKKTFLLSIVLGLCSCIGPRPSFMPKTSLEFLVIDNETNSPIEGAQIYMTYDVPNRNNVKKGPFLTKKNGIAQVKLEKEIVWTSASDLYFAGGVIRKAQAFASGYEKSYFIKEFEFSHSNFPITFKLNPFRNRSGSFLVLSQTTNNNDISLIIKLMDGPNSGEKHALHIMLLDKEFDFTGKKLYFRRSFEGIQNDIKNHSITAINSNIYFREGYPNEPYEPEN